jgi:hypothetical protein
MYLQGNGSLFGVVSPFSSLACLGKQLILCKKWTKVPFSHLHSPTNEQTNQGTHTVPPLSVPAVQIDTSVQMDTDTA